MIVEVRTYTIKNGHRQEFIEFFERRTAPLLQAKGMQVFGPLLSLEDPNVFVFLRAFPSLEDREPMKSAFYDSQEFKADIEPVVMPLLERYEVVLTETTAGFIGFGPASAELHATSH